MRRLWIGLVVSPLLVAGCAWQPPLREGPADERVIPYAPPVTVSPAPALPPVAPRIVTHGPRDKKRIALTFDACSTGKPTRIDAGIIDLLVTQRVPATLFLGGKWMEDHPDETRRLAEQPHFELANHSFLHPHMTKVPPPRVHEELAWTQDVLYSLTGRRATLFRPPYGEVDARLSRLVAEQGLVTIQFDLASGDPDRRISASKLADYVSKKARNGSIIVMHMNGNGIHTAKALPRILHRLRKRGFELVTVSELLGLPPPPVPAPVADSAPAVPENGCSPGEKCL